MENFAYSLVILNMGDGIGLPTVDVLHLKGRQQGIFLITAAHAKADFNTYSRDTSSIAYITLNGSNSFIDRVKERFSILKTNLSRYKYYDYDIAMYILRDIFYLVLDKEGNTVYD